MGNYANGRYISPNPSSKVIFNHPPGILDTLFTEHGLALYHVSLGLEHLGLKTLT